MKARLSLIVISRNEGSRLRRTIQSLHETLPEGAEIVVVDDNSMDASTSFLAECDMVRLIRAEGLGVARARNFGAEHASGDVLIFADAHMRFPPEWWRTMVDALDDPGTGLVAPAVADMDDPKALGYGLCFTGPDLDVDWLARKRRQPYAVPILPGCCCAISRDAFEVTGGFDGGLLASGSVDNELSVRFWRFGYEPRVIPSVIVDHFFRDCFPYDVDWRMQLHNRLRLAFSHFSPRRIEAVIEALRDDADFPGAMADLIAGGITQRREWLSSRQVRTDDWLFDRFCIDW